MLKLFKLTMGSIEKHGVAVNAEEMYEKRAELDVSFEYTPVVIEEVTVPGYTIEVYPFASGADLKELKDFDSAVPDFEDSASQGSEEFDDFPPLESDEEEPETPEQEAAASLLNLPFDLENATKAEMTTYLKDKGIPIKSNATVSYLQELVINTLV